MAQDYGFKVYVDQRVVLCRTKDETAHTLATARLHGSTVTGMYKCTSMTTDRDLTNRERTEILDLATKQAIEWDIEREETQD